MKYDCFISHSSEDLADAIPLVERLESRGLSCWIAPRNIRAGANYPAEIVAGIKSSATMVVLISKHALISRNVEREVTLADALEKTIFPVKLSDIEIDGGLLFYFSVSQEVRLFDETGSPVDKLISSIKGDVEFRGGKQLSAAPRVGEHPSVARPSEPGGDSVGTRNDRGGKQRSDDVAGDRKEIYQTERRDPKPEQDVLAELRRHREMLATDTHAQSQGQPQQSEDTDPTSTQISMSALDDMTAPMVDETLEDDTLAEAEVYLRYGLHRLAEDLLMAAVEKSPDVAEYHLKLLESYHDQKDIEKFESAAAVFKQRFSESSPHWEKIMSLGRDLGAWDNAADFHLSDLDEVIAAVDDASPDEFDLAALDDDGTPNLEELTGDVTSDLDLGSLDLTDSNSESTLDNLTLDDADLDGIGGATAGVQAGQSSDMESDGGTVSSSDEMDTMLDLAKAYIDMGDQNSAECVLKNIIVNGLDAQKIEARDLLRKLR